MTRRIWIIRHGKSGRPFGVIDHKRPLTKRAWTDAEIIGRHLASGPTLFVASTALRAMATAELVAGGVPVQASESLYQASTSEFFDVVAEVAQAADNVAFVGHNPAVTSVVNRLAGRRVTDNVPTLGVAAFRADSDADVSVPAAWQLVTYVTPKSMRT